MHPVLIKALDSTFGHPRGIMGRIGGAVMVRGNAPQEQWAVELADPRPGDRVLVLGHGPGVGLALTADAVTGAGGFVLGVDPSRAMRKMAAARCSAGVRSGLVEIRDGTSERTGCADASMDKAISVNNITMWDRPASFRELRRVLRPGGELIIVAHRHIMNTSPEELRADTVAGGFDDVTLTMRGRSLNRAVAGIRARNPGTA
ncbi:methyltransferase domain-containing protein [Dactylosporangium roseum]|uniref:Methyltransferase domain-containing protein n=1 Tax=Dactylosporangium roseum TaxID=47989 RepID=A0ABY5ZBY9_9ACTN|nr:methyltransferase domain-containing protein [Dactylosporangium roseum]UWZ39377.1 methyltransferase domain-containing protein [Dactylosporangium roseum]